MQNLKNKTNMSTTNRYTDMGSKLMATRGEGKEVGQTGVGD